MAKKRKRRRRKAYRVPGRRKVRKTRKTATKAPRRAVRRRTPRRGRNPVSLARTIISRVAKPGSTFTRTSLRAGLKRAGYRNVGGWIDQMIDDALGRRVISPVSKSVYVFTPAAANPCPWRRRRRR